MSTVPYPRTPVSRSFFARVGEWGVYDYLMPVGNSGISFVAALGATLRDWGPEFPEASIAAAHRRAGSTLAYHGLISGDTLSFIRQAIPLSEAEAAALVGISLASLQGMEAGSIPIPRNVWLAVAFEVCQADNKRGFYDNIPVVQDLRPRTIRVYPDIPAKGTQSGGGALGSDCL